MKTVICEVMRGSGADKIVMTLLRYAEDEETGPDEVRVLEFRVRTTGREGTMALRGTVEMLRTCASVLNDMLGRG